VLCTTCGCDNPDRLVFCQECGQRLGPRVGAPTPPIAVPVPASALPPPISALDPAKPKAPCPQCGANNQVGVRFCVSCGHTLTAPAATPAPASVQPVVPLPVAAPPVVAIPVASAPIAAPVAAPAAPQTSAPPRSVTARPPPPAAPQRPIVPTPAVSVSPAAVAPVKAAPPPPPSTPATAPGTRACPRCRGVSDAGAQFCRFCGGSLGPAGGLSQPTPPPSVTPRPVSPTLTDPPVAAFWSAPGGATKPTPPPAASPPAARAVVPGAAVAPARVAPPPPPSVRPAPVVQPSTYGRIVVITKEGAEGASFPLREQLDIGRTEGDVIMAEDLYLSPRHARLSRRPDAGGGHSFFLADLSNANGIYIRIGNPPGADGRGEVPLVDQDLFLVGQQVLKFDLVNEAEEGLAPATQHGTLLFGTPTTPRFARLSQRLVQGTAGDVFHLHKTETVLGRESGDIVFTDDLFLSRKHATLKYDRAGRRFTLADLGSSNGTFVRIRGEVSIKSGDQFRIGQQLFRVELSATPAP